MSESQTRDRVSAVMVSYEEKETQMLPCVGSQDTHPSSPFFSRWTLTRLSNCAHSHLPSAQGAISRETQNGYYVKSYKLEVSTNGEDWMVYGKQEPQGKPMAPPQWHAGRSRSGGSKGLQTHHGQGSLVPQGSSN